MKTKMVTGLCIFLCLLNLPIMIDVVESGGSVFERIIYTFLFLYVYMMFSELIVKLTSFLLVSRDGEVIQKRKKIGYMLACLSVYLFIYIMYIYSRDLVFLAAMVLAGGIAFINMSSTMIKKDNISYYYNDKSLELVKVDSIEEKEKTIMLGLENGNKEILFKNKNVHKQE